MNDWQMGKRIAVTVILLGLMMIATSSAQRPATGKISGHVVDSMGAAIGRASVFVRRKWPPEDIVKLVAHTDINGNFVLLLPEGGYDVLVTPPSFVAGVETISIIPGKTRKVQWKLTVLGCDFPGINCATVQ